MELSSDGARNIEVLHASQCEKCKRGEECDRSPNKKQMSSWSALLVGVCILLFGLGFGIPGIVMAYSDHKLVSDGVPSVGTVADVRFGDGRKAKRYKVMEVSYAVESGVAYSVDYRERYYQKREGSESAVAHKLRGTEMTVFYDPEEPRKAVVEGDEDGYFGPLLILLFMGGVGGFMTCAMADEMIRKKRKKNTAETV
ncbi:DUF3592 domain-containing protein [Arthrobacter zhaoxinii]|uniref:DUF3592 domain-containing protein n=1 Tax=Arthrobacter zhaoxinii TaxID=2964616 RepID=UPI002105879F|nr:DUF3592 domain-containing protein [Arthrobacter zhaoxinii]MCQ2001049.1 DUF3592 domain-containing protein [Arthrobacter zhaoxinii]